MADYDFDGYGGFPRYVSVESAAPRRSCRQGSWRSVAACWNR